VHTCKLNRPGNGWVTGSCSCLFISPLLAARNLVDSSTAEFTESRLAAAVPFSA
ncbi:hypothetical protein K0M31_001125, partial [Melipona bicolor]